MKAVSRTGINDKTKLIRKHKTYLNNKRRLNEFRKGFLKYVKERCGIVVDDVYLKATDDYFHDSEVFMINKIYGNE